MPEPYAHTATDEIVREVGRLLGCGRGGRVPPRAGELQRTNVQNAEVRHRAKIETYGSASREGRAEERHDEMRERRKLKACTGSDSTWRNRLSFSVSRSRLRKTLSWTS